MLFDQNTVIVNVILMNTQNYYITFLFNNHKRSISLQTLEKYTVHINKHLPKNKLIMYFNTLTINQDMILRDYFTTN